jgi:arylsulfatase A-like enzyme
VIDTLRADHLGCYGYQRTETPNIDNLASSGILFDQAISPLPETGPAVSSIFTSLYPVNHGLRDNVHILSEDVLTLAEILRDNGFRSAAFTDTFPFNGLHILQGFDSFQERVPAQASKEEIVQELMEQPLEWFRNTRAEKTLTFIHFFDPHMPYYPLIKSDRTKAIGYLGLFKGDFAPVFALWLKKIPINESDVRYMTSLYDDEVSFVDRCIGYLLRKLEHMGIDEETLIIITADHGESLGDHDYYFDHGDYLYDNQIRVPLIIKYPGLAKKGKIVKTQVRIIDIMPTILQILGIDYDGEIDGVSLLPFIKGKEDKLFGKTFAFSESDTISFENPNCRGFIEGVRGKHLSVRKNGMKLIYTPKRSEAKFELYDLDKDPYELENLIATRVKEGNALKNVLFEWLTKNDKFKEVLEGLDEKTREILKSLHYIH